MNDDRQKKANPIDARMAEALSQLPTLEFWPRLTEIMQQTLEIDRLDKADNPNYTDRSSCQFLLHHLLKLFSEQPYFQRHQDHLAPLMRLSTAMWELDHGRQHSMLVPTAKATNNAGQFATHAAIKGTAARAMSELMEGGFDRQKAAREVSAALRQANKKGLSAGTRCRDVTWKTVAGWRDEMNKGPHDKECKLMRRAYEGKLGPEHGTTATERGTNLVAELRRYATSVV